MRGIYGYFNFKDLDKSIVNINRINSEDSKHLIKDRFILVSSNADTFTNSDFTYDERFYVLSHSRIDNKKILLEKLHLPKNLKDSDLILHLYKIYENHAFNYIFGGFSIVIFDSIENRIIGVTDHLGIKPLYYSCTNSEFHFTSNIDFLFELGFKKNIICGKILKDILITGVPRKGRTIYKNIDALENNHFLELDAHGNKKIQRYYEFKVSREESNCENNGTQKKIKKLLKRNLLEHLSNDTKELCFALSGGLDSSSISCLADKLNKENFLNKKIFTHSAIFPSLSKEDKKKADESHFIKKVTNKINSKQKFHEFNKNGSLSIIDEITEINEPILGPNVYINFTILKDLSKNGFKVYIDGNGGDSTISHGYGKFYKHGRNLNFISLFREYRKFCEKRFLKPNFLNCFKRFILQPLVPDMIHRYLYSRKKNKIDYFNLNLVTNKKYNINVLESFNEIYGHHPRAIYSKKYPIDFFEEKSMEDQNIVYEARLTHALGLKNNLEIVSPFLDKRLMEFCLNVPLEKKFKNGIDRYYFRKAMKNIIPDDIRKRYIKADLSPLFLEELLKLPLDSIMEIIFEESSPLTKILDKEKVIKLHEKFLHSRNLTLGTIIYKLVFMGSWINKRLT